MKALNAIEKGDLAREQRELEAELGPQSEDDIVEGTLQFLMAMGLCGEDGPLDVEARAFARGWAIAWLSK